MTRERFDPLAVFALVCLVAANTFAARLPEVVWDKVFDTGNLDGAYGLALDPAGYLYVAGATGSDVEMTSDFLTVKYDTAGQVKWQRTWDSGSLEFGADVAVDGTGNAYVAGFQLALPTFLTQACLVKYGSDGSVVWDTIYATDAGSTASGVATAAGGVVYLAGSAVNDANYTQEYRLLKLDGQGTVLWDRRYDTLGEENGTDVATNPSGAPVITGTCQVDTVMDVRTISYTASGDTVWNRVYDSGADDEGQAVAVGPDGVTCVTGVAGQMRTYACQTLKYDAAGSLAWNRTFDPGNGSYGRGITTDAAGCIYVAGDVNGIDFVNALLLKYDPDGNLAWSSIYDTHQTNESAYDVAVDGAGFIYTTGTLDSGMGAGDIRTVKYRQFLLIRGQVTGASDNSGVIMHLTGDTTAADTTDATGQYGFADLPNGRTYTVTPAKPGYAFTPPSRTYSPLGCDQVGQDFAASTGAVAEHGEAPAFRLEVRALAGGQVQVTCQTPAGQASRLFLYDASGRVVESHILSAHGSRLAANVPMGVYFVRLACGTRSATVKVVVVE